MPDNVPPKGGLVVLQHLRVPLHVGAAVVVGVLAGGFAICIASRSTVHDPRGAGDWCLPGQVPVAM